MNNQKWDVQDTLYSGQGIVLLAKRDPVTGKPKAFKPVGNVSALKLSVATTIIEHKESKTGQRAIDKRLTTETKVNLSMTMDNFIASNLADTLRGDYTMLPGASIVAEAVTMYAGSVTALEHINVSSVVLKQGATVLTQFDDAGASTQAWDYKVNLDGGSFMMNPDFTTGDKAGRVVTGVTVGATTLITVPNNAVAGEQVYLKGFTGADAADLNNKMFDVLSATPTDVTIAFASTGKVYTTAATTKATLAEMPATVDYTYSDQFVVDALDQGQKELYMRFEGLNTADDNSPVIVDVFKFATDPLKELDLISDTFQAFVMEGSVLVDPLRTTGSKFFSVRKLS